MNNHPASLVTLLSPGGHTEPADEPLAAAALHKETGAPRPWHRGPTTSTAFRGKRVTEGVAYLGQWLACGTIRRAGQISICAGPEPCRRRPIRS